MKIAILIFIAFSFVACERQSVNEPSGTVAAFVPVYAKIVDVQTIELLQSQATVVAGKIYAYNNFVYQNEMQKGFHIIKNMGANNFQKVGFLKVPFCTEIAIKGNYLYCNNINDLVVFNITDPANPLFVKRVKEAFPVINQTYPPVSNTAFECVDNSKGIVINWERKTIPTPKCRR